MNKTRDVINWYHCQSSSVNLLHETRNRNKTYEIVERKRILKEIRHLYSFKHYKLSYLEGNQFFFRFLFTCRKLDYNSPLVSLASCERWDTGVVPKTRRETPRQTCIIKCGIHLSSKAACTKHRSGFGSSLLAMPFEWTFLHSIFKQIQPSSFTFYYKERLLHHAKEDVQMPLWPSTRRQ
jgi:hypothetical protein